MFCRTRSEQANTIAEHASDVARDRIEAAREKAAPVVQSAVDRARPKVEAAQSTLVETVLPAVSAAVTAAAASLAEAKEEAAPYVEQAREGAHVGSERAHDALKVLKGEATITERRRSSWWKWLLGLGLVGAVAAAVVGFRAKQHANDPWATPLTDPISPALREPSLRESSLRDRAAEKVSEMADAKDHTGELQGGTEGTSEDGASAESGASASDGEA